MTDTLPLLCDPDSYLLELDVVSDRVVCLLSISRFAGNQNVEGESVPWYDLDTETRRAIIQQINRRYVGRTVKI